jgi:hypothetical protein
VRNMVYKIPLELGPSYKDQNIVVRSADAGALVKAAQNDTHRRIMRIQLLNPRRGVEDAGLLPTSMPIDLCLTESRELSGVKPEWTKLAKSHTVRLVVPVVHGFRKVMKDALQAGLRVKLEIDQPDEESVRELMDGFIFFTQELDVKEPVDLFFGLFRSFFSKKVESLWEIQEEHPHLSRYVTDTGAETISKRLESADLSGDLSTFLADHKLRLFVNRSECCSCRFFDRCEGYFKVPRPGYDCLDIKRFFGLVSKMAGDLRADLAQADQAEAAS